MPEARLDRLRTGFARLGLPGEAADLVAGFVRQEIQAGQQAVDDAARRALMPELEEPHG